MSLLNSYVANIFQNGTSDPTASIFENTMSNDILWERVGVGQYRGTLTGAFPIDKTWCSASVYGPLGAGFAYFVRVNQLSAPDSINIDVLDDTLSYIELDGLSLMIEIRVYS